MPNGSKQDCSPYRERASFGNVAQYCTTLVHACSTRLSLVQVPSEPDLPSFVGAVDEDDIVRLDVGVVRLVQLLLGFPSFPSWLPLLFDLAWTLG